MAHAKARSTRAARPKVRRAPPRGPRSTGSLDPCDALRRALAAARAQDFAAARDALIEAWRARRSPATAELVDLVAATAPDALTRQLGAVVTPRAATTLANWLAVRGIDDPRISGFAIDALGRLPFTAPSAQPFLRRLIASIGDLGDVRIAARADAIAAAIGTRINRLAIRTDLIARVRAVVARLPAIPPSAEAAALERELRALLEPLRSTTRSAEALLAEVYANPADDAPRLVLADLLIEQGDPRGELISLQLERGDGAPSEREQALLAKHGKAWLGNLAPVLSWGRGYSGTRFRRGFVAKADIILSVGKKLEPIREDLAWSTVEELDGSWDVELLARAPLPALRLIERQLAGAEIARLARRAVPLSGVRQIRIGAPAEIDAAMLHAAFPELAVLALYWHGDSWRDLGALGALGIDTVAITNHWIAEGVAAANGAFERYIAGLVGAPAPFARFVIEAPNRRGEVTSVELVRGPDGAFARA